MTDLAATVPATHQDIAAAIVANDLGWLTEGLIAGVPESHWNEHSHARCEALAAAILRDPQSTLLDLQYA